jgi:hypothetical protein
MTSSPSLCQNHAALRSCLHTNPNCGIKLSLLEPGPTLLALIQQYGNDIQCMYQNLKKNANVAWEEKFTEKLHLEFFCELSKFLGGFLGGVAVKLNRKAATKSLPKSLLWFYEKTEALACLTTKEEREAHSRNRGHCGWNLPSRI